MESLPYLTLTLRIPMEWIMTDTSYNDTIIYLMTITEEYLNIHGSYEGLVIDIVGVQAILIINIMERIICNHNNDINNHNNDNSNHNNNNDNSNNNNSDNNNDNNDDTDEVSTDDGDDGNNAEMQEFFI
ncbi:hypothetical protein PV325_013947 [Microctonus aethiopoides]|nr:hypothetical protein PV325_013947 [Microctonus aethiopoides]